MAEPYEIPISSSGAVEGLEKLERQINETSKASMSLKQELRSITEQLTQGNLPTEQYEKLKARASEIKDVMADVAEETRANAGPAIESLGNNFGLLTQRISNLDFEGAGASFKSIASNIKNVKFKDISDGISGMTSGLATLGKAILANPILLLASVIIGIAMNFDKLLAIFPSLNEGLTGVSEEMTNSLKASQELVEADKQRLQTLNDQDAVLKEQGFTEREILKLKEAASIKQLEDLQHQIGVQKQIAISQIETSKRNRDILKGLLEFITFPIQALLGSVDMLTEKLHSFGAISDDLYKSVGNLRDRFNTSIAELVFDPAEVQAEATKTLAELDKQYQTLNNQRASYHNQISAIDKAAADKRRADQERADQAELERRKKLQGDFAEIEKLGIGNKLDLEQTKTGIVISESQKQWQLKQEELRKEKELNDKYEALEKQKQAARVQAVSDGIGALIALNESFTARNSKDAKRQFQINKGLGIAQASINTFKSATSAFAQGSETGGPVLGAIYAGIAVAAGLAQINKIRQTQYNESGGGGNISSGSSSAPSISSGSTQTPSPQFNPLSTSFATNQPSQVTPQAYVLAGGVSSSLEAEQKIRDRARL
jgi:hypothetical protein